MSLDTKRAEIRKLEEQAQQREDALKRSESMLEEDAMRFDAFLKENDYKGALSKSTTDFCFHFEFVCRSCGGHPQGRAGD